jgi:hypothetical protein
VTTDVSPAVPPPPRDHGWVDDGLGVLSCVAGDEHTPTHLVACPYYLRQDVAARLPGADLTGPATVTWKGQPHYKMAYLARPQSWRTLIGALDPRHRVRPLPWSLFSAVHRAAVTDVVDPRDAYRAAIRRTGTTHPAASLLATLADDLADPGNDAGSLGLTGSAALDPARLGTGNDIDLIIYPGPAASGIEHALRALGARFLSDLAADADLRTTAYQATRLMPRLADPATSRTLLARRNDVAWLGQLRIDLTYAGQPPAQTTTLMYDRPSVGRIRAGGTVTAIGDGFPVRLTVNSPHVDNLLITARGYQGAFRVGDRLRFTAALHRGDGRPFASLDDASGHRLTLKQEGQP